MDNIVECAVCTKRYENWIGSTPCCGSIAYLVVEGVVTTQMPIYASLGGMPIDSILIDMDDSAKKRIDKHYGNIVELQNKFKQQFDKNKQYGE